MPTKNPDSNPSEPIVKISFLSHNRAYEVGIKALLKELDTEISDDAIMIAVKKLLSKI